MPQTGGMVFLTPGESFLYLMIRHIPLIPGHVRLRR